MPGAVTAPRIVYIVDDDTQVRTSLALLLRSMGLNPWPFSGGLDFLDGLSDLKPGIVLLDMRMPDPDGIGVLGSLQGLRVDWPVIAMTGHGDVKLAVSAMKLGAFDFLEKPMQDEDLHRLLESGFAALAERKRDKAKLEAAQSRLASLTSREAHVLREIADGHSSRDIADALGIGVRTVEMHRANLIRKLRVKNAAEAVALAAEAGPLGP